MVNAAGAADRQRFFFSGSGVLGVSIGIAYN